MSLLSVIMLFLAGLFIPIKNCFVKVDALYYTSNEPYVGEVAMNTIQPRPRQNDLDTFIGPPCRTRASRVEAQRSSHYTPRGLAAGIGFESGCLS